MKFPSTLLLIGTHLLPFITAYNGTANSSYPMWALSADEEFSFNLEVVLSLARTGGSATGEVLRIASQIVPGDYNSWYQEFKWVADQLHAVAISTQNPVSAREAYFRAASYYRFSSFFLIGNKSDARIYDTWNSQLADYDKALSLMTIPGERISLKGNGFEIPAIFYKAFGSKDKKAPTLIVGNGYDASQEDSYHAIGWEVLSRGWNFVTYEGPGQPTVIRQQRKGFIPEWWEVVSPVVDYVGGRADVDADRLALIGISFGGLLAPRAASREPRLKAVLSIDGMTNFQAALMEQFPSKMGAYYNASNETAFNAYTEGFAATAEAPTAFKWIINQGKWVFNTESDYYWFDQLKYFSVNESMVANITGYGWVGEGQDDTSDPGQAEILKAWYDAGGKNGTLQEFYTDLGAGEHCQIGAEPQLAQKAFDWLEEVFQEKC